MGLIHDIGGGILGIILFIVAFVILFLGVGLLLFGQWLVGLILIIIGGGMAIASRKRIYGH